jgi:transcriptional regulator with XRE-family HTH domain
MSRRFNQARLHADLTLAELEKKSGCAMSMLSGIATGDRMPRIDSVAKIARALGASAGWLAYGDGPRPEWLTEADSQAEKSNAQVSDS